MNGFFRFGPKDRTIAIIKGGPLAPKLRGRAYFIEEKEGTEVIIEVEGLPPYRPAQSGNPPVGPHGLHIHENGICRVGNPNNPFLAAGDHWNPTNQPHGHDAGDLPNLFSNGGYALMRVYTNKFKPKEVINKSVIIHKNPDDFRTHPAGNAGKRLACGIIKAN
jgi:Cu-Zn family superoxide dismutase